MRAPILLRSALCAVVLLAGCGTATPPPAADPVPADPVGQRAAAVLRQCGSGAYEEAMRCREAALLEVLRTEGVRSAMQVVERMGEMDSSVRRDGHVYSHAIGLAAYTGPDEVSEVFGRCTPSYQSGCYHGVIQSYFADLAGSAAAGVTAEAVNGLCEAQRADAGRWLLFQCAHGMGHGLMLVYDHHLPRALAGCDLVTDPWEREACYGGAFMENVVQATAPHHTVGRPQVHGDEHAHHAEHAAAEPEFRALDPAEPLYPCTALDERYLTSCYQMQTSAVIFFAGGDVAAAVGACDAAPERYRDTCYQSMGRDVSAVTLQDHQEARRLCALAGPRYGAECQVGYVKNVVDVTARPDEAFAFCHSLAESQGKARCYEAVGEEIWALARGPEQRAALCAGAEAGHVATCRRGAGLGGTAAENR